LGGQRFVVQCLLGGRPFESFHVDVGAGITEARPIEYVKMPSLLAFAGIRSPVVPCYPLDLQLAEKIHAYTRPHSSGRSTRIKDFIDILLISEASGLEADRVRNSIETVFGSAGTHVIPGTLSDPPEEWSLGFASLANDVGLDTNSLVAAAQAVRQFIDPVLSGTARGRWDPEPESWGN
jgi:hypothetical protein